MAHTQKHTDGHGNSMTESAQSGQFSINVHKIYHLAFGIMATPGSSGQFYVEGYYASIEPIISFMASHYSRRDSEMWRFLGIIISTNPTDTIISSQKTKSSMPPKPLDRLRRVVCLMVRQMFDRAGQDGAGWWQERLLSSALVPLIFWLIALEFQQCPFVKFFSEAW